MKRSRFLFLVVCVVSVICILCGCSSKEVENPPVPEVEKPAEVEETTVKLPGDYPMVMNFLSGAGGWSTNITLKEDGSFVGEYTDSEMGIVDVDYPNGTLYICKFSGKFEIVKQIDDSSYMLKLVNIETKDAEGEEWIKDGIKYITSVPYGLDEGEDFILYTPDKKTADLSEEFLSWWPLRYEAEDYKTLSVYGLHNLETDYGFFSQAY